MTLNISVDDAFRICAAALDPLGYRFDRYDVILAASDVLEQVQDTLAAADYQLFAARYELETAA